LVPFARDAASDQGYGEIEFVITPETFNIHVLDSRRIFTDGGRDFPADVDPSFLGISIGLGSTTKGDGHYDVREETRNLKGALYLRQEQFGRHK
jgi:hypothetical protein